MSEQAILLGKMIGSIRTFYQIEMVLYFYDFVPNYLGRKFLRDPQCKGLDVLRIDLHTGAVSHTGDPNWSVFTPRN